MARRPRYHLPQGFYHVMIRGNDKQLIFFCENDYWKMSLLIQEGVGRFGHKILAYCFMPNHVHLIIQVDEIPLSRIMQNITFRYTRHVNRVHGKIGHLFQGRYKAIIIDGEPYLKELVRYVHLNPVRAGMINIPELYHWSSHNVYLGNTELSWLNTDYILSSFDDQLAQAVSRYKNFILAGIDMKEDCTYEKGLKEGILGDEQFLTKVRKVSQESDTMITLTIPELVQTICNQYEINLRIIKGQGKSYKVAHVRAVLALLMREMKHVTLEELAQILGRDASGLSRQATSLEIKSMKNQVIREELDDLRSKLVQMSRMSGLTPNITTNTDPKCQECQA